MTKERVSRPTLQKGLTEEGAKAPSLERRYALFVRRRWIILITLAVILLCSLMADIAIGPSNLSLGTVLGGLFNPSSLDLSESVILWDVRFPYAAMAVVVGGALGLAGAEMQTVLNNPLASPFTLGISAAATLGAALVLVLDINFFSLPQTYMVPLGAFATSLASILLIQLLMSRFGSGVETIVLFGIAMVFALDALVALLQFIADSDTLQQVVFWTFGSLGRATWEKIAIVGGVLVICLLLSSRDVWALTTLRGGEDHARSAGVSVDRLRFFVLLRVSLLAAVAVAFVGKIGFIGLVAPHIARILVGEDHRFYLPATVLAGAMMLSLASIASKTLVPGLLIPVGIVTALVGIPLFMTLILGRGRQ